MKFRCLLLSVLISNSIFAAVDTLATSLSLLGNHMFPGQNFIASVNHKEHEESSHDKTEDVCAEVQADHVPKPETEKTECSACQDSASSPPADRGLEDAACAADSNHADTGEFVVAMLAKAKLEEQGIGVKGQSSPLLEAGAQDSPEFQSHCDEDVTADSWRQHRKHVFVLSEAGKPIYSRYGSEEALSSTMGVMMALVSFVQSGDNIIRSVYSGDFCFLCTYCFY